MTADNEHSPTDNASQGNHPWLWSAVALLAFVLIAAVGYKYRSAGHDALIATAPLNPNCLLNQTQCSATLEGFGSVRVQIAPSPIIAAAPMQVQVALQGFEASGVEIDFRGESMNMGLNQYRLVRQQGGEFAAEVVLPVCVRKAMFWIADVVITTPQGRLRAPFRFESVHP